MSRDDRYGSPEPWEDPEFAPIRSLPAKPAAGGREDPRGRALVPWLALATLCVSVSFDSMIGPLIVGALGLAALTVGIVVAAMILGMIGTVLFAVGDRIVAWVISSSRWPED